MRGATLTTCMVSLVYHPQGFRSIQRTKRGSGLSTRISPLFHSFSEFLRKSKLWASDQFNAQSTVVAFRRAFLPHFTVSVNFPGNQNQNQNSFFNSTLLLRIDGTYHPKVCFNKNLTTSRYSKNLKKISHIKNFKIMYFA